MGLIIDGRPTWAEVDLSALERNLARVRERAGGRRVIAVVKADGYGHGAVAVSRTLVAGGCDALAVATLEEAAELRGAGLEAPIVLLEGLHSPGDADAALELRATPVVNRLAAFEPLEAAAGRAGRSCGVHLKFDTGMGRLGFGPEQVEAALARMAACRHLVCEGVLTHLADADDPSALTPAKQRERFSSILERIRDTGLSPGWTHIDNSAGLVQGPTPASNAVRVGLVLYGSEPAGANRLALEPVMSLCTRVIQDREVPKGTRIGYGGTYTTSRASRVLTLPIGYADGLPRAAGNRFSMGLRGRRVPLVGRVSMDLATLCTDSGAIADDFMGAEILVFGRKEELEIRVEELAAAVGTIVYEILVGVGRRVPRRLRES